MHLQVADEYDLVVMEIRGIGCLSNRLQAECLRHVPE